MAMREDCKFFQRRAYSSGDVRSFCALGLAPEAPWRCPEGCKRYQHQPAGDRSGGGTVPAGAGGGEHHGPSDVAAVLSSADEIIGALAPELAAEEDRRRRAQRQEEDRWWNRVRRSARWRR